MSCAHIDNDSNVDTPVMKKNISNLDKREMTRFEIYIYLQQEKS